MPKTVEITAYKFEELDDKATFEVLVWLNEFALENVDEHGNTSYEYFDEIYDYDPDYVIEHCYANEYLFDKYGNAIHHLINQ